MDWHKKTIFLVEIHPKYLHIYTHKLDITQEFSMQVHQRGLMAALLMATLVAAPLAEAKRAGGGKSHGMSRSNTSSQSYQQQRQAAPAPQQTAPQKSGPGVGTMVAAGVAGAAVGAVAANAMADDQPATEQQAAQTEEKGGIPSWIWVLLAAALAFFVFRKLGQKKNWAPITHSHQTMAVKTLFLAKLQHSQPHVTPQITPISLVKRSVVVQAKRHLAVPLRAMAINYQMVLNQPHFYVLHVSVLTTFNLWIVPAMLKKFVVT